MTKDEANSSPNHATSQEQPGGQPACDPGQAVPDSKSSTGVAPTGGETGATYTRHE